jgi:5'-nucleotidase
MDCNELVHNDGNSKKSPRKRRAQGALLVIFCVIVIIHHVWWISPTLDALGSQLSILEENFRENAYVGTGHWRNRGLSLVNSLRSMLGEPTAFVETIEFTVRKLQLLHLTKDNNVSYNYTKELRNVLYPTSDLVSRLSENDGYREFATQILPFIHAWEEVKSLFAGFKTSKQSKKQEAKLKKLVARLKRGDARAAALIAQDLMSETRGSLQTFSSPQEAASLNGPSIAILRKESHQGVTLPDSVIGFEIRNHVARNDTPDINLAFYKQIFEKSGPAVIVLRPDPDSNVTCIVPGQDSADGSIRGVQGIIPLYECSNRDESLSKTKEVDPNEKSRGLLSFEMRRSQGIDKKNKDMAIPVAGLLFGADFVGGCNAASRILDAFEHSSGGRDYENDLLWGQEMQNVFSSVSASMRKDLFVASFDLSSSQGGAASKVRCDSVASFWTRDDESATTKESDLQLWQSYRDAAASGVGLDWELSECLVRLPLEEFKNAKIVNQTIVGSPVAHEELGLGTIGDSSESICHGFTGSTCTLILDEGTVCEFSCEHSGSYAVSRGVACASGQQTSPGCFAVERKLETPVIHKEEARFSYSWFLQQEADPVRWGSGEFKEEPHSVSLVFTSDVHGRFFYECGQSYCYPGAPHIASVIRTVRSAVSQSGSLGTAVLVDAGDATFGSQYNETLVGMTMNSLGYDAMALGNHEFDIGRRLDDFSKLANFPIVSTNVVGVPFATDFVRVRLKGGSLFCLLGVSANEFNPLAGRNVSFSDESSIIQMAQDLRSERKCNHVALLSHAGIEADKRFAEEGKAKFDAIIGGHSHVLMGVQSTDHTPESSEFGAVSDMSFPFTSSGNSAVAHTGANGRYLGLLRLHWMGFRLVYTEGNLIPLDKKHGVFPDFDIDQWQSQLIQNDGRENQVVSSEVEIENSLARNDVCGQTCRTQECLMGNLATDAMVSCVSHGPCSKFAGKSKIAGTIALLESGTLRACVSPYTEDFSEILPWPNNLVLLTMTGASVRKMLEHGLKDMREGQGGAFLQTSGLRYVYRDTAIESISVLPASISHPRGQRRLITFTAGNAYETDMCGFAEAEPQGKSLDNDAMYLVVVTDWLASGGDGYGNIVSAAGAVTTNTTLRASILEHAKSLPFISAEARSKPVDAKLTSSAKQGLSGFVGGALSFLVTYPLYTLFVQRSVSKDISFSFRDLFAGSLIGILATALSESIYFFVYSVPELAVYSAFTRSTIAALTNSLLTTPLWVIATHQQVHEGGTNAFAVAKHVYYESGALGFFTGLSMNVVMCIFPVVRQVVLEVLISAFSMKDRNQIAAAAAASSWVATLITFPIQQLRVRMQSGDGKVYRGHYFDGVLFKLLHSCSTSFVLFLVKQHSETLLCILEG